MRITVENDHFSEVEAAVSAGLSAYNNAFLPLERSRKPFALALRDADETIIGGLTGTYRMNWLYVDLFWIADACRGKGHGKKLINAAELEAKALGLDHIELWTWSFQAPHFYEANGFYEIGRFKDQPQGHDRIFYRKDLL